jgi:hypothetical protein
MRPPAPFGFFRRLVLSVALLGRSVERREPASGITFCIAHFNNADFLEVTLDSIRRYHPDARVVVADARSVWPQLSAASAACQKAGAELHPLLANHRHTGLLNYLFRQIRTKTGVFLDQDCALLRPLDPLLEKMVPGILLAGPKDEMRATHPNVCARHPQMLNERWRFNPQFVHASFMVMKAGELRAWAGRRPFLWDKAWGPPPVAGERYYGITERVRRKEPRGILWLDSKHTGYGLGTVYLDGNGTSFAFHNWFSGQLLGRTGLISGLDVGWLQSEMARFFADYRAGKLNMDLR